MEKSLGNTKVTLQENSFQPTQFCDVVYVVIGRPKFATGLGLCYVTSVCSHGINYVTKLRRFITCHRLKSRRRIGHYEVRSNFAKSSQANSTVVP